MSKPCYKFPECSNCINREFDPFQCVDCNKASNFEEEEDTEEPESVDYSDFLASYRDIGDM